MQNWNSAGQENGATSPSIAQPRTAQNCWNSITPSPMESAGGSLLGWLSEEVHFRCSGKDRIGDYRKILKGADNLDELEPTQKSSVTLI
jgi:hypothetical protein